MTAHHFAQPPFDSIALMRLAQCLAGRESDTRPRHMHGLRGEKPTHRCRRPLATGSVDALIICVLAQTCAAQRKDRPAAIPMRRVKIRTVRVAHRGAGAGTCQRRKIDGKSSGDPAGCCSVAVSGAHAHALATGSASPAEHCGTALGLHPRAEAVLLDAAATVGLKRALGHGVRSWFFVKICALSASI
jgi:hypothetical protein